MLCVLCGVGRLVQIPLSAWYVGRFQFGPAEWLWRSMTYGEMQPMRISRPIDRPVLRQTA